MSRQIPTTSRVALIPGDGIGPEVTAEAERVLEVAASRFGFALETATFDWGCERYERDGAMMPEDGLQQLSRFDAVLLGAVGDAARVPDDVSLAMLLRIRRGFDLYVNLRPIRLLPGVPTPIRTASPETVDLVVVRENTEGEYATLGGIKPFGAEPLALQTAIFTRKGCERVIRYAFQMARERAATRGRTGLVTNCTKSNALIHGMVFWDRIFAEVAAEFDDVRTDAALVDALTMRMINDPGSLDVVVASNLFGDIITDLGAVLQGGIGLAASANLDPRRLHPAIFEPVHGSAPTLAGHGKANPIAAIAASALLLDYLGQTDAAEAVQAAIAAVLKTGAPRTADLGGTDSTATVGEAIRAAL